MVIAVNHERTARVSAAVAPFPPGMGYELHVAYKANLSSALSDLLRVPVPRGDELSGYGKWQNRVLATSLWSLGAWAFCIFIAQSVSLFVFGHPATWGIVGWALAVALLLANWLVSHSVRRAPRLNRSR